MSETQHNHTAGDIFDQSARFLLVTRKILSFANRGVPRIRFLKEVTRMLVEFFRCDAIELRKRDGDLAYRWRTTRTADGFGYHSEILPPSNYDRPVLCRAKSTPLERLCRMIFTMDFDPEWPEFSPSGGFILENTGQLPPRLDIGRNRSNLLEGEDAERYRSFAAIPYTIDESNNGLMLLFSSETGFWHRELLELYEEIARTLGLATADRRAQAALRERVKELTCLYGISRIVESNGEDRRGKLQRIVELLPSSWQYPEIAVAKIVLDDESFCSRGYRAARHRQKSDIVVGGERRGFVEVAYTQNVEELSDAVFLREEVSLISEVARQVANIIEKEEAEKQRLQLQEQLRHADRLATLGKLAAGVAHEINEPLSNILGFAQLSKKSLEAPQQVEKDLDKIIGASLRAREIVKNLLIFARQVPAKKSDVNINRVVRDAIAFFENRCRKNNIELELLLDEDLPRIAVDPSQMNQILVNLVVNAIQAMPDGGKLRVITCTEENGILLAVEDTGMGMKKEVIQQIFNPFFTTKDVKEGTGLGLSVVHGIITSHGGSIRVESEPKRGARFEVRLPLQVEENAAKGKH